MQVCYIILSRRKIEAAIEQTSINITTRLPRREFWYFCHSEFKISSDIQIYILLAFKSRILLWDSLQETQETISVLEVYDYE